MSTVPKAQKSDIAGLTVIPDEWNAYPSISRSIIKNCTFTNLADSTSIERSALSDTFITNDTAKLAEGSSGGDCGAGSKRSKRSKGAYIERSTIQSSQIVVPSTIGRSVLSDCHVEPKSNIGRTTARSTRFVNAKHVERSELTNSFVLGESVIERSTVVDSVVSDKTVMERTDTHSAVIARSRIERSKITDCDVKNCTIERTVFNGMILQYGIWKNGDLVGRTSNDHEVVIKPRDKSTPVDADAQQGVLSKSIPTSSSSELQQPMPYAGAGWKAAEAERERLGMQSDPDDEDSSPDELEDSNDDDGLHSSLQPKDGKNLTGDRKSGIDQRHPALLSEHAADFKDPPPPYEQ